MKIEIESLDIVYFLLDLVFYDDGLEILNTDSNITYGYSSDSALLVYPFDEVSAHFRRSGENYYSQIYLSSLNKDLFSGISKRLDENLMKINYKYFPRSFDIDDGQGYVFNKNKERVFCIKKIENYNYSIALGTLGAETTKFPHSVDVFRRQIGKFEEITNLFIDSVLVPFYDREEVRFFENETIQLQP